MNHLSITYSKLLLPAVLYLAAIGSSFGAGIDEGEYTGIRDVSIEIIERFPPGEFTYVGVGRSPTALIAFLQLIAPTQSINVPLSGAREIHSALESSQKEVTETAGRPMGEFAIRRLENFEKALDRHFDLFLKPALLSGKKVVFIDYVVNGSYESALKVLDHYLKKQIPPVSYDFVSIAPYSNIIGKESWLPKEKNIDLSNYSSEFQRRLRASEYDQVAEFGGWNPGLFPTADDPIPKESSNYAWLKNHLVEKMTGDPLLKSQWAIHQGYCAKNLRPALPNEIR